MSWAFCFDIPFSVNFVDSCVNKVLLHYVADKWHSVCENKWLPALLSFSLLLFCFIFKHFVHPSYTAVVCLKLVLRHTVYMYTM